MDEEAERVHEGLRLKAFDSEEHNRRIGEISARHQHDMVATVGSCKMCSYADCSGFRDAGEIGNLSDRIAKLEARVEALEDPKP
jgi:hypothetical protein